MKILLFLLPLAAALGQNSLSLRDAVAIGLKQNQSVMAADAGAQAADARIDQARAGMLPKVQYTESLTRSNNPVFVFSSLLTQHQFGLQNFEIYPLNRPGALDNFQSLLTVDQPIYDGGASRNAMKSARMGRELQGEEGRRVRMELILSTARAYYGVLLAAERLKAAELAQRSAEADLSRAEFIRNAGMTTDMDVLSIKVHLASVREQVIQRSADVEVAHAALNDAMGLPLDAKHTLISELTPVDDLGKDPQSIVRSAPEARPEIREMNLATGIAKAGQQAARNAYKPMLAFHAAFEADRQQFADNGGANWLAAVSLHWNLFNGLADQAKVAETTQVVRRAEAEEKRARSAVALQVERAWADYRAAKERILTSRAAVTESEESLRITKNRYEAGISNVTDLLRNETAVLDTKIRLVSAIHDERVAAATLEYSAGTLSADSEVLQ